MATKDTQLKPGLIDIVKHRWIYIGLSILFLLPGIVFMALSVMESPNRSPIRLGIDFTGGTILEYGFHKEITQQDLPDIRKIFEEKGYPGAVVQIQEPRVGINAGSPGNDAVKAEPASAGQPGSSTNASAESGGPIRSVVSIRTKQLEGESATEIQNSLQQAYGNLTLLQKNSIGPTLASELLTNGLMALLAAYVLIVGYLTFRFQFDYAVCAIIALVHDTLFVFGLFSMLGYLYHVEVDSLFITGILTVIGFSVHDTIVVFDRLRENSRLLYSKKLPFGEIANISINQTLARSINTSLTALLTLLALYFLGGETTRDFVFTMIIGIVVGTYSSIFVASAMLTWWRERNGRLSASMSAA